MRRGTPQGPCGVFDAHLGAPWHSTGSAWASDCSMAHARIGYTYAVSWGIADKAKPHLEKAFKLAERLSEKDRLNINAWYAIANLDYPNAIQIYREIIAKYPLETESYWRFRESPAALS